MVYHRSATSKLEYFETIDVVIGADVIVLAFPVNLLYFQFTVNIPAPVLPFFVSMYVIVML